MSGGNSFKDEGSRPSWPRPNRPITLSDITGPSVAHLLDQTVMKEAKIADKDADKEVQLNLQSPQATDRESVDNAQSSVSTDGSVDGSLSRPIQQIKERATPLKSSGMQPSTQRHDSSHEHKKELPFQYEQVIPTALIDHDFGFPASIRDAPSHNSSLGKSRDEVQAIRHDSTSAGASSSSQCSAEQTAYADKDVDFRKENNVVSDTDDIKMDVDENAGSDVEVYCICRTSDTDRFMM